MSDSLNNQNRIDQAFGVLNPDEFKTHGSWIEELLSNRQEHTVAGAAFGVVRDVFGTAKTADQRAQRAQFNDQCAELAADVAASVTRVRPMAAGLIRSGMLLDPNGTMEENAAGVTKNFAEGWLLNNVVRSTSAEGAFGKWTTAKFGGGLTGEMSNHLIGGLGFSAVRTGFDSRTWLDDKGQVSLHDGALNSPLALLLVLYSTYRRAWSD